MQILAYYDDVLRRGGDGAWRFARRSDRVVSFNPEPPGGMVLPVR